MVLGKLAEDDLDYIARWTAEHFGARQAAVYVDAILDTIDELSTAEPVRSKARDEIAAGLRTLHMAKPGRRGSNLLLYVGNGDTLTILRILHDSMEISRHVPEADR
jgi:toxin ParE1/3/4